MPKIKRILLILLPSMLLMSLFLFSSGAAPVFAGTNRVYITRPAENNVVSGHQYLFAWSRTFSGDLDSGYFLFTLEYKRGTSWWKLYDAEQLASTNISNLPGNGTQMRARVRFVSENLGTVVDSDWRSFVNVATEKPGKPIPTKPANNVNKPGNYAGFNWDTTLRVLYNQFQLSRNSSFTQLLADKQSWVSANSLSDATGILTLPDKGETLFWRVRSCNGMGCSQWSDVRKFVNGPSSPPPAPEIIAPEDNGSMNGTDIAFSWLPAPRSVTHRIQVAADSGFASLFHDYSGQITNRNVNGFSDNGLTFFWRVQGCNSKGCGPWTTRSLINGPSAVPETPQLSFPADGGRQAGEAATLIWYPADRAVHYQIQTSMDPNFGSILENIVSRSGMEILRNLPDNGAAIYWRIRACNSLGCGPWSSIRRFVNGPSAFPETPQLTSPADGANIPGEAATLTWNPAKRAMTHHYQAAEDDDFQKIVFEDQGQFSEANLSLPDNGREFHWRVRASNSLGHGEWSKSRKLINGIPPKAPILELPQEGGATDSANVLFKWKPSDRAESYYLEVSREPDFINVIEYQNLDGDVAEHRFFLDGYSAVENLYWRVTAFNKYGHAVSAVRGFQRVAHCQPAQGAASGIPILDTCRFSGDDYGDEPYFLLDKSRQARFGTGGMGTANMIQTGKFNQDFGNVDIFRDADNEWSDATISAAPFVHRNAGRFYDYLLNVHGINGFDNRGSSMTGVLDTPWLDEDQQYECRDESFYDQKYRKVYYCRTTRHENKKMAVTAHEWSHGLTRNAGAALTYAKLSGALDEAFSDWMGVAAEHYYGNPTWNMFGRRLDDPHQSTEADGVTPRPHPRSIGGRYWFDVSQCDPNPGNNYCGVHKNSTVAGHMFYLLSQNGQVTHQDTRITVDGIGLDKAIRIAVKANVEKYWGSETDFLDAAKKMAEAAANLYDSSEAQSVRQAWTAVGALPLGWTTIELENPDQADLVDGNGEPIRSGTAIPGALGDEIIVEILPSWCHAFAGWQENGEIVGTNPRHTFIAGMNRVITAVTMIKHIPLTLEVLPAGCGSVSADPEPNLNGRYFCGTEVALSPAPDAECLFSHWDGDVSGDQPEISVIAASPITVRANFKYSADDHDGDGLPSGFELNNGLDPDNPADALQDKDNDGLINLQEYQLGTNIDDPDSDSDTIPDGWEVDNGLNPLSDDADLDPDQDGLNNLGEYQSGTNPADADSDDDQMPDGWEVDSGLNPLSDDALLDKDNDGLSNLDEYQRGTTPNNADSDNDGMPDGWETAYLLNPLYPPDADYDPDQDGLSNLEEYRNQSNPNLADTDDDGMPDGWEVDNGLRPDDPSDARLDPDRDGMSNLEEYQRGTDPLFPDGDDPDQDGLSNEDEDRHGTDPRNPDSDGDSIPDGVEAEYGLDPLDASDAWLDLDRDGLYNVEERPDMDSMHCFFHRNGRFIGTSICAYPGFPNDPDSDNDGMPDGWEARYRLDLRDAADALGNPDGDCRSNIEEYKKGTNPLEAECPPPLYVDPWYL